MLFRRASVSKGEKLLSSECDVLLSKETKQSLGWNRNSSHFKEPKGS
jgi:hypothetical protein